MDRRISYLCGGHDCSLRQGGGGVTRTVYDDRIPRSAGQWWPLREGTKEEAMAERLGLGVIPGVGWSAREVQTIARQAEEAGFDAICAAEVNNDVMATAQLMGAATRRITVGTWIANIYLRHSYACAQGAALIADATGGRLLLGLGVSHPPVNKALGIDMQDPPAALRRYVTSVRSWLKGEGPPTHLPQRPAPVHAREEIVYLRTGPPSA